MMKCPAIAEHIMHLIWDEIQKVAQDHSRWRDLRSHVYHGVIQT